MSCVSKRARTALAVAAGLVWLALAGVSVAVAHSFKLGSIEIGHLWSPPPKKGIDGLAVYGPILNEGARMQRLQGATSSMADTVRFHEVKDGKESWHEAIDLAPGKPVSLAPWRTHIWLSGLKQAVKVGDWVDITLDFGAAGKLEVKSLVEKSPSD